MDKGQPLADGEVPSRFVVAEVEGELPGGVFGVLEVSGA